jgi:CRISPR-associated protein Cas5d
VKRRAIDVEQSRPPLELRVWGNLACFTRPEMKVERVSYPVPTPSGARGILEAIFWKPEFRWRIQEIWILKPIRFLSILRNEVTLRASSRGERASGFVAPDHRAQRHTLALRDVDYVIRAQVEVRPGVPENPAKFRDQFRRRVKSGSCFTMPYLGCREFSALFGDTEGSETPIERTEDLGPMLYDIEYSSDGSGRGTPRFFDASLENGIVRMPPPERLERVH